MMMERDAPGREEASASLLVINPNSNPRVTENIRRTVSLIVGPTTQVVVVNPADGPFAIENADHLKAAEPKVLDLVRGSLAARHDGYVLAAFDDIGLERARAIAGVPVVGAVEAGIAAARTIGRRFTVITTVEAAVPGILRHLQRYGAADIATARAAGIGVAEAAEGSQMARDRVLQTIHLAVKEDKADAILFGSGGLTGMIDLPRTLTNVPIIDSVLAAVKMAEVLAMLARCRSPNEAAAI